MLHGNWWIAKHTLESLGTWNPFLKDRHKASQLLLHLLVLLYDGILLLQHGLQIMIRLTVLQLCNPSIQPVYLQLGPLSDSSLRLPVIGPLPLQLVWGEVCDATG